MKVRRGYADSSWGQIHYAEVGGAEVGKGEAGQDKPVCVFFHESPQSLRAFETALPSMADSIRAIALDTSGYGNSEPPPHDQFEIPDYAARLLEAIDDLGLDRFAVAGVHTGASIAIEVARQAGMERTTGAVLTGVPLFPADERAEWLASWAPKMAPDAEGSHLQWAWERFQRVWGVDSDPAVLHLGATQTLNVIDKYEWAYNAAFRYDPEPYLPELTCPVLLLNAENDLLAKYDEPVAALLSDARIEWIPGLGGQLPIRVPDLYAQHIVEFVTQLNV